MKINYISNNNFNHNDYKQFLLTKAIVDEVKHHHESYANYNETALVSLKQLSKVLGLKKLNVKDESSRFELNSFKVPGAANGMRTLGNPLTEDTVITSGESGAVSIGGIESLMSEQAYEGIKQSLKLNSTSVVLTFSTEGDTDHEVYRDVVWYGNHSKSNLEV